MGRNLTVEEARQLGRLETIEITSCAPTCTKPGVYVLQFETGVKIGMAKNLQKRLEFYKMPWMQEVTAIATFRTQNPFQLEKFLKKEFIKYTRNGSAEYFYDLPFDRIVEFIKNNRYYKS